MDGTFVPGIPGYIVIVVDGVPYPFCIEVNAFGPCRPILGFTPQSRLSSVKLDDISLNTCTTEMVVRGGKRLRVRFIHTTDALLANYEIAVATTHTWAHRYHRYVNGEGPPPSLPRDDGLTTT